MNFPVNSHSKSTAGLSRRDVLHGSLMLGGAVLLTGCQPVQRGSGGVVNLPPGVWPDPKEVQDATVVKVSPPVNTGGGLPSGVIPRSAWTSAKPNLRVSKPMNGVRRITVHHSAMSSTGLMSQASVVDHLEKIRRNHVSRTDGSNGTHWVDIGYHFIIDPSGRIWEGRPLSIEGAHVSRMNDHNLGVMLLGNFNEHRPTQAALETLDSFVAGQMMRYRVAIRDVYTHQELRSTQCPGKNLQAYMKQTRMTSGRMSQSAAG